VHIVDDRNTIVLNLATVAAKVVDIIVREFPTGVINVVHGDAGIFWESFDAHD
jgi:acyl-CoA reductase-like NAD-dependent aldehyde dehydrogenase